MNPEDIIIKQIGLSLETFHMVAESLSEQLELTAELMTECLLNDGKIFVCGMGCSGATGASFVANMQSKFERDRPGLPAINLANDGIIISAITQDLAPVDVYARQIYALSQKTDILLVLSSESSESALIKCIQAAHDQMLPIIALTGNTGGDIAPILASTDIELRVETDHKGSIQLTHQLLLNCLVELIENALFGNEL